jgi:murein DD-endopeptidase MepM/ murein hydrolase activator NlpD
MKKGVFSCLLAIFATPIFAGTVSSTSILINSENTQVAASDRFKKKSFIAKKVSFTETVKIRNSLVKVPAITVTSGVNTNSLLLDKLDRINHIISSVLPISSNIKTSLNVSLTEKSQSFSTTKPIFPKFSRSSLFSKTANNSKLINPAPKTERIASVFGWRIRPFSGVPQMHHGIDYGAPLGSSVVAAKDGIVTKVVSGCLDFGSRLCGDQYGNHIEVDHGNGMIATYAHLLNNSITVQKGTKVWQNQEIAKVGSSGWSTGAHLDFRIKVNGEYQDPANYVNQ